MVGSGIVGGICCKAGKDLVKRKGKQKSQAVGMWNEKIGARLKSH